MVRAAAAKMCAVHQCAPRLCEIFCNSAADSLHDPASIQVRKTESTAAARPLFKRRSEIGRPPDCDSDRRLSPRARSRCDRIDLAPAQVIRGPGGGNLEKGPRPSRRPRLPYACRPPRLGEPGRAGPGCKGLARNLFSSNQHSARAQQHDPFISNPDGPCARPHLRPLARARDWRNLLRKNKDGWPQWLCGMRACPPARQSSRPIGAAPATPAACFTHLICASPRATG